jgi:NAD(P)-dependent dehydrogenase (short-subunit alcohol dehydrogenase family)
MLKPLSLPTLLLTPILIIFAAVEHTSAYAADTAGEQSTVLITGANRGIGFELVRQFAALDWRVIATTRNPDKATALKQLTEANPNISIETLDVTSNQDITNLTEKYSGTAIDILLLNAAKGPQKSTATAPLSRQDFSAAADYFQVNAIGPMQVTQAFMDNVKASRLKQVVVLSSDSGSFVAGSQLAILYHYKASKAALNMYFHTLAFETKKRGVTVVMLHPGMVGTNPQLAKFPGAITPESSVSQMLEVMDKLTLEDNGRFIDYRGDTMPW